ncbi:MAG: opioid growth factor receptor-related protein [Kangiellaceae bacterium]|jgi:hypothetical protein|nr:opioid growth factor receptor-related protein [Kangiellaceae bacterium]
MNDHPWISFYLHKATDHKQRLLADIWMMTYDELEKNHDFIQWLFPLIEPSPVNPDAPTLTDDVITAGRDNQLILNNVLASFDTIAAFWGFCRDDNNSITRTDYFGARSKSWLTHHNHNHLRITRVLKHLSLIGFDQLSINTCSFLIMELNNAGLNIAEISAINYWLEATESNDDIELSADDFNLDD